MCLKFSGIVWLGHIGAQIEFSVPVGFFSCVEAWIEFSVLVYVFVFVRVVPVPFFSSFV